MKRAAFVRCATAWACGLMAHAVAAQPCTPYWSRVGGAGGDPPNTAVTFSLAAFDDGSGPALYKTGPLWSVPGVPNEGWPVCKWNGVNWEAIGAGLPPDVDAASYLQLARLDDGAGERLYLLGFRNPPGPSYLYHFAARWDAGAWTMMPRQFCYSGDSPQGPPPGYAIPGGSWDDGSGSAIYGVRAHALTNEVHVARWDGAGWTDIGPRLATVTPEEARIFCWAHYDDGSGDALYMLGRFRMFPFPSAPFNLARWDGVSWSSVGGAIPNNPTAMAVFDDGSGDALYVSDFIVGHSTPGHVRNIGRWDGHTWTSIGAFGEKTYGTGTVYSLTPFDDGSGPSLFVTGIFRTAAGMPSRDIARWDGSWHAVPPGLSYFNNATAVFDDGRGPSLFIGGDFHTAGGGVARGLVQYVGCPNCYADCNRDGALTLADFGCFQTKYAIGDPYANCNLDFNPGSITNGLSVADYMCFQARFAMGCP
ncbi:MAG: hypothetical protein IT437_03020 [Phycisphaerales bacterium]|nr:hypothetical protein [Phycisphaerales bacterium]